MNEPYTVTLSDNGREALLQINQEQPMRAWNVARALKGRWAPGLRAFHMTPARAEKWKTLFDAGFDATTIRSHDQRVWVFVHEGKTFTLAESIRLAETPEDTDAKIAAAVAEANRLKLSPIVEMEVSFED
jgi:hypothetical protein